MSRESETTVRVRYAETDQMGVVYHSNFFVWFEVGRVELLRSLGVSYKQMEQEGDRHIVVVEATCKFKRPARYDDVLRIRTRLAESRSRTMRFEYEVFHAASGELLATGETRHVVCDGHGRPKSLPARFREFIPLTRDSRQAQPA
jgi:acyl-CoA thioester hydrolase